MACVVQWFSLYWWELSKSISLPPQRTGLTKGDEKKKKKKTSSSYLELFLSICAASLHNDLSLTAFQNHFQTNWREGMAARFALSFLIGVWGINVLIKKTLIEFSDRKLFISTCSPLFFGSWVGFFASRGSVCRGKEENRDSKSRQCSGVPWLNKW